MCPAAAPSQDTEGPLSEGPLSEGPLSLGINETVSQHGGKRKKIWGRLQSFLAFMFTPAATAYPQLANGKGAQTMTKNGICSHFATFPLHIGEATAKCKADTGVGVCKPGQEKGVVT